mmetsp:Transcript_12907/g.41225  ORF Transcript_12907/g.41225 Transcript_12907/m.41225 type:complete len:201 (+) Transcript_12907:106-708(+)
MVCVVHGASLQDAPELQACSTGGCPFRDPGAITRANWPSGPRDALATASARPLRKVNPGKNPEPRSRSRLSRVFRAAKLHLHAATAGARRRAKPSAAQEGRHCTPDAGERRSLTPSSPAREPTHAAWRQRHSLPLPSLPPMCEFKTLTFHDDDSPYDLDALLPEDDPLPGPAAYHSRAGILRKRASSSCSRSASFILGTC